MGCIFSSPKKIIFPFFPKYRIYGGKSDLSLNLILCINFSPYLFSSSFFPLFFSHTSFSPLFIYYHSPPLFFFHHIFTIEKIKTHFPWVNMIWGEMSCFSRVQSALWNLLFYTGWKISPEPGDSRELCRQVGGLGERG